MQFKVAVDKYFLVFSKMQCKCLANVYNLADHGHLGLPECPQSLLQHQHQLNPFIIDVFYI